MNRFPRAHASILAAATLVSWLAGWSATSQADLFGLEGSKHQILRLDPTTGDTLGVFADLNGIVQNYAFDMTFGPDNNLYVADYGHRQILRFNGSSGAYLDVYATTYDLPTSVSFDTTGNLYVGTPNEVEKFAPGTGAPLGNLFTAAIDHSYKDARIGPDGLLYLLDYHPNTSDLVRFNPDTGARIDTFISGRVYDGPTDYTFGANGEVYFADWSLGELFRYAGTSQTSVDSLSPLITDQVFVPLDYLTYAPDGSLLGVNVTGSIPDWFIQKYDAATGKLIANFQKGEFEAFVFSAAVPEPSAGLLVLLTLLPALIHRRRP
ncbi:MAG TPA: hypothetical protein VH107_16980 [Lacipirellulaceae bacterium]|jgi:hypothetical protein|nr:hypothetical protein [Lacipirellulaceae bacterium]